MTLKFTTTAREVIAAWFLIPNCVSQHGQPQQSFLPKIEKNSNSTEVATAAATAGATTAEATTSVAILDQTRSILRLLNIKIILSTTTIRMVCTTRK